MPNLRPLLPLFLLSLTGVLLEVALTRLCSAVLYTQLTALVLAFSLAALGLGAAFAHRLRHKRPLNQEFLPNMGLLLAVTGVLALVLVLATSQGLWLSLFALPFFFLGAYAAGTYLLTPHPLPIYCAEVLGGALGALLAPLLLERLGDVTTVLLTLQLPILVLLYQKQFKRLPLLLPPLVLTLHLLFPQFLTPDPFAQFGFRPHLVEQTAQLGGRVLATAVDSYARTDLVQTRENWLRYLYTDRMYAARIVRWDGQSPQFPDPEPNQLVRLKRLPFAQLHPQQVLILGAGGGLDVALALQAGAQHVDAVEVNAAMLHFVHELQDFCGHVYDRPEVTVQHAEARRFLQQSNKQYDLIQLSLMQTDPAAMRSLAGVQNWVFTQEAVQDYLQHLRAHGVLAIVQNTADIADRTVATLKTAQAKLHVEVLQLPENQKNPFGFLILASQSPLPTLDLGQTDILRRIPQPAPREFLPPTDTHPFFYPLHAGLETLYLLLAVGVLALATWLHVRDKRRNRMSSHGFVLALLLGVGFMLTQAALLATGQFLLGFPPLAVSMTLGALLLSAGLGALLGRRLRVRTRLLAGAGLAALVLGLQALMWTQFLALPLVVLIALPGLPLGLCLPACLELFGGPDGAHRAALYATDGLAAVAGGALATVLAARFGIPPVFAAASATYALAALLSLAGTRSLVYVAPP